MRRQYEWTSRADIEAFEDGHAFRDQDIGLLDKRIERHHHTIADQATNAFAQDARGNQVQYRFLAADDECVPCIVASLEPYDGRRTIRE